MRHPFCRCESHPFSHFSTQDHLDHETIVTLKPHQQPLCPQHNQECTSDVPITEWIGKTHVNIISCSYSPKLDRKTILSNSLSIWFLYVKNRFIGEGSRLISDIIDSIISDINLQPSLMYVIITIQQVIHFQWLLINQFSQFSQLMTLLITSFYLWYWKN